MYNILIFFFLSERDKLNVSNYVADSKKVDRPDKIL